MCRAWCLEGVGFGVWGWNFLGFNFFEGLYDMLMIFAWYLCDTVS